MATVAIETHPEEAAQDNEGGASIAEQFVAAANEARARGDLVRVREQLRAAFKLSRGNGELALALGHAELNGGDLNGALEGYTTAAALLPNVPLAHACRALALQLLGQSVEAGHAARRALSLDATEAIALKVLARIHLNAGQPELAQQCCQRILNGHATDTDARQMLEEATYSNLIDLRHFFEGEDGYVVLKLPEHFPNYRDHSDLDILCRDRRSFLRHTLRHAKSYQARGFKIHVLVENGHWHVDFYAPGATELNLRFDLVESLADFKKFSISPVFEKGVLDYRRQIVQNNARVLVPRLTDDLAIRCLEYLAWRDVRPDKIAHWRHLERAGNWDFIEVVNRHTNLNLSVETSGAGQRVLKSSWKSGERQLKAMSNIEPFYRLSSTCQIPHLDEIYHYFFGETPRGCFVEVGAFDGEYVSNTSCLADLGWKGFYIEPVPAHFEKCKARHAANRNVTISQLAVGSEAGTAEIHVGGPLSTCSLEMKQLFQSLQWAKENFSSTETIPVRQVTLEDYLSQNSVRPNFELLCIDVEGFEWNVLRNFDIEKWRPQMVIIELHDQNDNYLPMRETCLKVARYFEDHCYLPVFKDQTNTVYVCDKKASGARPRLDYFLIWGHGTQHTREILEVIRSQKAVEVLAIHKKTVADIAKFVGQVYSSDFVPVEHLAAKTRYLLQTPPDLVLILIRNLEPRESFYGEGAFRHIQCQRIKAIKEEIRNRFNPRKDGKRTEDHVIHASDFESQTEHILEILGLPPVAFYTRRPNRDLDVPYHLPPFENYKLKEVPVDSLYANILGRGVVPISQSPHYRYVLGDRESYQAYHAAHFGRELTDDHLPEAFDRLIASFDSNRVLDRGNRSFIVAVKRPDQGYQILDGVHRASILRQRNVESVLIVEPLYGDAPRSRQNGPGGRSEERFKAVSLVVSKDRPLQLDGALRSWKRHCRDAGSTAVNVLYKASTSRLLSLYRRVMQEHPEVDFVQEGDFRRDALRLLRDNDYVMFVVDDTVFTHDFTTADIVGLLEKQPQILGFSLRLGRNTTYCYSMNQPQKLPDFEPLDSGCLKYRWPGADHDFGYPLEVSSSVYRSKEMLHVLEGLDFKNPNALEEAMSTHTGRFRARQPFLACWEHSRAFSIPANKVQQICDNRAGSNAAYSSEALAVSFAQGQRIQTHFFDGFIAKACHQEADFKTAPEREPVPLVTVVVPCYKQAEYLREAVASVVAQTFSDWELIIVNDGSPDDTSAVTRQLIKEYAGRRIRLLEQRNGGLAHARNAGIRAGAGAYVLPLDADDKIKPELLARLVPILDNQPKVGFAYTDIQHFGEINTQFPLPDFDRATLITKDNIACVCALVRRSAWEQAGGYNEAMREGYEDWDFWIGCVEHGWDGCCLHEPLFQYRKSGRTMLSNANEKRERLVAQIIQNHPKLYDDATRQSARELLASHAATQAAEVAKPATSSAAVASPSVQPGRPRLRITYLISSILGVTGGNQTLLRQAEEMRRRGHDVTIVTYTAQPDWFKFKTRVIQAPAGRPLSASVPPSDVVVATYFANAPELMAIKAPVKIYYAQGDQFVFADATMADTPKNRQWRELSRASYLLPGIRFVPNSRNLADAVQKLCGRHPDAILPVCTDQTIFRPLQRSLPGSKFRLLIVGPDARGTESEPLLFKGIQDIQDALHILARKNPHFTAVRMAADAPDIFARFPCEYYIAPSDEMKTMLFGTSHIHIYASHYDSCPRPPQEAMAGGCAVVCTATAGAMEYCRDGENALLVPIKSPEAIANAVERLIQDHALREKLVRGGLATAAQYPREREWNEWETILFQFMAEAAKPSGAAACNAKAAKPAAQIQLPPCARLGELIVARDLLNRKQHRAAWEATFAALQVRPFHPEACLMLANIALAAGAGDVARQCAQRARQLAPEWSQAKRFLNRSLRGQARLAWLLLPPAPPAAPRLSVCLIVKNEEEFLGRCLASVRDVAAQIIVVDTGSTDGTVAIAKEHGAEVHHFAWCDDFSAARNAALEHATGDWILSLDADEELLAEHKETLRREMQSTTCLAYRIPILDTGCEQEGCSYVPRLFRNAPGLFFVGRVHEQVFSSIHVRCQQWGLKNSLGQTTLLHHGYSTEVVASRDKIKRNLRLLEMAIEELPNEPSLLMNYGLELVRSGRLRAGLDQYVEALRCLAALPPSEVTPELRESLLTQLTSHLMAAKCFEEIVKLWQTPVAKAAEMTASQHFGLGLAYIELKRPAEAAEQMRQCLAKRGRAALTPANKEILKAGPNHCLALCLWELKQKEAAALAFAAALADDPSSRGVRFDFARFQFEGNQPLEALKLLNQLVAEDPKEVKVWQLGAQIALSRPDFVEFARDWTGEAFKHCSQDSTIVLQRAEALLLTQEVEQALPLWIKAHSPKSARHLAALVLCECLTDACGRNFPPADEQLVSREFQKWYVQLINSGANSLVYQLNESMEKVRHVLPTFAAAWERAVSVNQSQQTALGPPA
jgi:FkbM family methyltransferase